MGVLSHILKNRNLQGVAASCASPASSRTKIARIAGIGGDASQASTPKIAIIARIAGDDVQRLKALRAEIGVEYRVTACVWSHDGVNPPSMTLPTLIELLEVAGARFSLEDGNLIRWGQQRISQELIDVVSWYRQAILDAIGGWSVEDDASELTTDRWCTACPEKSLATIAVYDPQVSYNQRWLCEECFDGMQCIPRPVFHRGKSNKLKNKNRGI